MKALRWFATVTTAPAAGIGLLAWWSVGEYARPDQHLSSWAALLLFGGLACSWTAPRVAVAALYGAFLLQLVRVDCRFDQAGWIAYAAIMLTAVVLAVRVGDGARRRVRRALLPLGVLIGLFTNLPGLGPRGMERFGLVSGTTWTARFGATADGVGGVVGLEPSVGLLVWTAGAVALIVAGWMTGSGYRARRLQWAAEAATAAARSQLDDSRSELRVTEERERIAQDVHDVTAHSLSVILAQADGAAAHAADGIGRSALTTIAGSARSALVDVRTLLEHLEHPTDAGAEHAVEHVARLVDATRTSGREVLLEQHGVPQRMPAAASLAAYRITQEALANAVRHGSGDGPVRLTLDWRPSGLALTVASPLLRPVPPQVGARPGRGLVGMEQRARLAGGWLTSGPDQETGSYLVTAVLPTGATAAPR